jgi:hypothetical protein
LVFVLFVFLHIGIYQKIGKTKKNGNGKLQLKIPLLFVNRRDGDGLVEYKIKNMQHFR